MTPAIGRLQHHNTRLDSMDSLCWGVETLAPRHRPLRYAPRVYGGLSELLSFVLLAAVTVSVMAVLWLMIILSAA